MKVNGSFPHLIYPDAASNVTPASSAEGRLRRSRAFDLQVRGAGGQTDGGTGLIRGQTQMGRPSPLPSGAPGIWANEAGTGRVEEMLKASPPHRGGFASGRATRSPA